MNATDFAAPAAPPRLIEPHAKRFLSRMLSRCQEYKIKYFSIWMNLTIFVVFVSVVCAVLYYRYKGRPTEYEKQQRLYKDQMYVLSKIRAYHDEKKRASYANITNLPITANLADNEIALRRLYGTTGAPPQPPQPPQ